MLFLVEKYVEPFSASLTNNLIFLKTESNPAKKIDFLNFFRESAVEMSIWLYLFVELKIHFVRPKLSFCWTKLYFVKEKSPKNV
jgi:hypothetical protein